MSRFDRFLIALEQEMRDSVVAFLAVAISLVAFLFGVFFIIAMIIIKAPLVMAYLGIVVVLSAFLYAIFRVVARYRKVK